MPSLCPLSPFLFLFLFASRIGSTQKITSPQLFFSPPFTARSRGIEVDSCIYLASFPFFFPSRVVRFEGFPFPILILDRLVGVDGTSSFSFFPLFFSGTWRPRESGCPLCACRSGAGQRISPRVFFLSQTSKRKVFCNFFPFSFPFVVPGAYKAGRQ